MCDDHSEGLNGVRKKNKKQQKRTMINLSAKAQV
jgi:hypothetical protein